MRTSVNGFGVSAIILTLASAAVASADHRWSCRKFPDHNVYFYNGGSGPEYSVTHEVAISDGGSWHNYSAANVTEVGSFNNSSGSDQMNVTFTWLGHTMWAGITSHTFDSFPCAVSAGLSDINTTATASFSLAQIKYAVGHEIGHQLGVWHDNDPSSIMNEVVPWFPSVAGPSAHDAGVVEQAYCPSCATVALLGSNGYWVAAEGGGGQELVANRTAVGIWERFKVHDRGGGWYALQAHHGRFVKAVGGGGGTLIADANVIGHWEEFQAIGLGGNGIALRASTGHYWYRTPPGYYLVDWLFAAAGSIGLYETFYYYWV